MSDNLFSFQVQLFKKKKMLIIIHTIFWIIYFSIEFILELIAKTFTNNTIYIYALAISFFYILFKILKSNIKYYFKILSFTLIFFFFIYFSLVLKFETFYLFSVQKSILIKQLFYIIDKYVSLLLLAYIYSLYFKLKRTFENKLKLENELFDIEINYLDSRLDTHFFYNTVNLFYLRFLQENSPISDEIEKISSFAKDNL